MYGVFEIKPALSRETVLYAGAKAASVRRLRRTSVHAAGLSQPREPIPIVAGLLCLGSYWKPPFGDPLVEALAALDDEQRIDLLCAIEHGAVEVSYDGGWPMLDVGEAKGSLMFLLLRLFARLQQVGTVAPLDLREYGRPLEQ